MLGLESVRDAEGNVIHEAPMSIWANFRQRALDVAILEMNAKTDRQGLSGDRKLGADVHSQYSTHGQDG